MARSGVLLAAGACLLGLFGSSLRAQTTQLSYRFDSLPEPPDTLLYDDATITGGYLRLTAAQGGQIGTFIVDSLPKERRLASVKIGFLLRINKGGSSVPADGFSVSATWEKWFLSTFETGRESFRQLFPRTGRICWKRPRKSGWNMLSRWKVGSS